MNWLVGQKQMRIAALALAALLCAFSSATWAIACDAVFTNGVQSHAPGGNVTLRFQSVVAGGGSTISTPTLTADQQVTCGGGTCVASGSPAASSTPTFVTGTAGNGNINAAGPTGSNTNVPAGDYGTVSVVQSRILTFNTTDGLYLMESLTSNYQSEVRFRSGDYWVDGNMSIGQETQLTHVGSGTVRIFVDGNVNIGFRALTSGFTADELLIYATGNITFANEVALNGFFYAGNQVQAGFRSQISGGVSGAGVTLDNEVAINYGGGVLPSANFEPFCSTPTPAALVSYWAMDEFSWSGASGEVLDSSGNGNNGTAQNGADTDGVTPAIAGDPGTCRYGEFDGTDDYIQVPGISNTLNATASLAFWIRTSQAGNNTVWEAPGVAGVELNAGTDDIFWGWLDASGRIGVSVGNNNTTRSNASINNGAWRHVVLTRDHQAGTYKIYVDGALDASGSIATGVIGTGYDGLGRIRDTGGAHNYLEANLDEVRIYSGILSDAQVTDVMQETHPCADQLCPVSGEEPAGGLLGDYYNNMSVSGTIVGSRVDGPINFDWGTGSPGVAGVNADQFSVDWNGQVRITHTGEYRFRTYSDDGVRLWVDLNGDGSFAANELLIENWDDHAVQIDDSLAVNLNAGQVYAVRMQWYENAIDAEVRLHWSTPSSGGFVPIPAGPTPSIGSGLYHCVSTAASSYSLIHSKTGVTCEAELVTITALDAAGDPIAPPAGTEIELLVDPAASGATWVGGNFYTFNGIETNTKRYLSHISPTRVTPMVSETTGSASGTGLEIEFTDVAIRFYGDRITDPANPIPIANQVAGLPDNEPVLRVVRTDDDSGECEAAVTNQQRAVDLAFECRDPGQCVTGQTLTTLNDELVAPNNLNAVSTFNAVSLVFDNEGFASIPLEYSDVGELRLYGRANIPVENDPAREVTVTGSSNNFVVRPYTLVVVAAEDAAGNANPGTESAGSGFVAAGETFTVVVEARNADDNPTPNFGNEITAESVRVELQSLMYPTGGNLGALTSPNSFSSSGTPARHENSSLSWNNVGSITLTPRLLGDNYLEAGDLVSLSESATIGRFYPQDFALSAAIVSNACGSFSYMNQGAIGLDYTLLARSLNGGTVSNYDHGLGYVDTATMAYVAENANAGNGASLSGRVNVDQTGINWMAGQLNLLDPEAFFARQGSGAPDGPYADLQWGTFIETEQDNRPLADLNMNATSLGDCIAAGNCDAAALGGTQDLRYGRLIMEDVYGPEVINLPAPFYTEYWDGSGFVRSVADNCTEIPRSAITYPAGSITTDANLTVSVGGGASTGSYSNLGATAVNFSSGNAGQLFSAPGTGNTGSFEVEVDLQNLPWLRFDWNQDGNYSDTLLPPARIGFGSYRGHDRVIYWREVFE